MTSSGSRCGGLPSRPPLHVGYGVLKSEDRHRVKMWSLCWLLDRAAGGAILDWGTRSEANGK
eukprot:scaffold30187_cov55-Attheya_sp.AAC.1